MILTEQFLKKMSVVFHFGDILHIFIELITYSRTLITYFSELMTFSG
jgi:hypothetical protein